jgi:hypothetical protein
MGKTGEVIKTLRPGQPGTKRFVKKFGNRLVCVRYRVNQNRRVRSTTVELLVDEGFYDRAGYQNHKRAVSSIRHSS